MLVRLMVYVSYLLVVGIIIMTRVMATILGQHSLLLLDCHSRLGRGPQECLRHNARVVVSDLPLVILPNVHKRVSALHLVTCGAHGEF